MVYVADATALLVSPLATAIACSVSDDETAIEPVYSVEPWSAWSIFRVVDAGCRVRIAQSHLLGRAIGSGRRVKDRRRVMPKQ